MTKRLAALQTRKQLDEKEREQRLENARNRVPNLILKDGEIAIVLLWKDFTLEAQSGVAEPLPMLQHYYRRNKRYFWCSKVWSDEHAAFIEHEGEECLACKQKEEGDQQISVSRKFIFSLFDATLIHRDNRQTTRIQNGNKAAYITCGANFNQPCGACEAAQQAGPLTGAEDEWKEQRMFPAIPRGNSLWSASNDAFAALEAAAEQIQATCGICNNGELSVTSSTCAECGGTDLKNMGYEGYKCTSCGHLGKPDHTYRCSNGCDHPQPHPITRVPLKISRKGKGAQDTVYTVTPMFSRALDDEKYNKWRRSTGINPINLAELDELKAPTQEEMRAIIGVHNNADEAWKQQAANQNFNSGNSKADELVGGGGIFGANTPF